MFNKKLLTSILCFCLVMLGIGIVAAALIPAPAAPRYAAYSVAMVADPQQDITQIAVTLGLGGLLILIGLFGLWLANRIKNDPNTSEPVRKILNVLTSYGYMALFAGESLGLKALKNTSQALEGADKAKIAAATYGTLPEHVQIGKITFNVREFINPETWSTFVEGLFQKTDAFVLANETYLKKQVDAFRGGNTG